MKQSLAPFILACFLAGCAAPPTDGVELDEEITYTFTDGQTLVIEAAEWNWVDQNLAPQAGPGIHAIHLSPTGELKCESWWSIRLDGSLIAMKSQCPGTTVWAASPIHRAPGLLPTWDSVQNESDHVGLTGRYLGPLFAPDGGVAGSIMLSRGVATDAIQFYFDGDELPSRVVFDGLVGTREGDLTVPRIDSPLPERPSKYSNIWYESSTPIYDMPVSPADMVEALRQEAPEVYASLRDRCATGGELFRFSVTGQGGLITNEGARMSVDLTDGQSARVIWSRTASAFDAYQVDNVEAGTGDCRRASTGMNHSEAAALQQKFQTGGAGDYSLAVEDYGTECPSCLSDLLLWRLGQADSGGSGLGRLYVGWVDGRSGLVLAMSVTAEAYGSMATK